MHFDIPEATQWPAVSIVIAAFNELENLKELLPLLEGQNYPNLEIIVVDDRSQDGTYDYLLGNEGGYKKVSFVRILDLPDRFTAKKYAVTMGIKKAKNELILLTDADCRPASQNWVMRMVNQLTDDKDIVLGFGPYHYLPGKLNAFIRYETFQTALQYFSLAKVGMPFMGVGRNLLYRKSFFWKSNGFAKHAHLLSGDDDLLINANATSKNVELCFHPDAWMPSAPKETFKEWVNQKRRHLSVGKYYKIRDRLNLGFLWGSFIGMGLLFLPTFLSDPSWFQLPKELVIPDDFLKRYGLVHWDTFTNWHRVVLLVFCSVLLIRWLVLHVANKKLGRTIASFSIPVADLVYFFYLFLFGIVTSLSNPKMIKWR